MKMDISDYIAIGCMGFLLMIGLRGLTNATQSSAATSPCAASTIIETKTQECLVVPIPGSRKMDGISDQKIYCRDLDAEEKR